MSNGYHIVVTKDHSPGQRVFFISTLVLKLLKIIAVIGFVLFVVLILSWGFIVQKVSGYYSVTAQNDSLTTVCESIDSIKSNYASIVSDINHLKLLSTLPEETSLAELIAQSKQPISSKNRAISKKNIPSIVPVIGVVSQPFIAAGKKAHDGVDFSASKGTVIKATAKGKVISTSREVYLGKVVTIDHGNGYITKYGHCSEILVRKGQNVDRGFAIALVGNSGKSSGPHLHYQVIKDSVLVDPSQYY